MIKLLILGATLTLTPLTTFAYCDPYSDDFAACTMAETEEALSRPDKDYADEAIEGMRGRFDAPDPTHADNQDFMDGYCMLEGYRAAICQ